MALNLPFKKSSSDLSDSQEKACSESKALEKGLNIAYGKVIYKEVAEAFNLEYTKASSLIH